MNVTPATARPTPACKSRSVRVVTVTGGKGGTGKSTVAANLAVALAAAKRNVVLLDADLGLANIDVLLGLQPERDLTDLLAGRCGIEDLAVRVGPRLRVIPAASGSSALADLTQAEVAAVIRACGTYRETLDFLIVDTAAGISADVALFSAAADDVAVVVCDEPASITDAYALMKVLSTERGVRRFKMVVNKVRGDTQGRRLFDKLERTTDRFLNVLLELGGIVPEDAALRQAIQCQSSVLDAAPGSPAAVAFRRLAAAVAGWNGPSGAHQRVQFFADEAALSGRAVA